MYSCEYELEDWVVLIFVLFHVGQRCLFVHIGRALKLNIRCKEK